MAELTTLTNPIAEGAGGGATLYEIDQVDSQCCGLNKQTVKAAFKPSALSVESLDSSMCASQGSTFVVPKHKLTDYEAMETTCCCCMTTTIITLLTTNLTPTSKRPAVERNRGVLVGAAPTGDRNACVLRRNDTPRGWSERWADGVRNRRDGGEPQTTDSCQRPCRH